MTATMTSAIERYVAALNSRDREAYLAAFSPDAVVEDPVGGRPFSGHEGLARWFKGMERTWQQFEMTTGQPYAGGDRVAVSWSVQATAQSGKTAAFSGINLFTIDDEGLISRLEGFWDAAAMMQQIS